MTKGLRDNLIVTAFAVSLFWFLMLVLMSTAIARDFGQWADSSAARREWFKNAQVPEAARGRIPFKSCCEQADVFKTRFCVGVKGDDQWEYEVSPERWEIIPPDIISDLPGLDGEPILFRIGGKPVCFFKGSGGL